MVSVHDSYIQKCTQALFNNCYIFHKVICNLEISSCINFDYDEILKMRTSWGRVGLLY